MSIISKAIKVISNGPALPLFVLWYGLLGKPSPVSFISYLLFTILFHEFTVKGFFHRRRPTTAPEGHLGLSFPSSHSFTSGIAIVISFFFNFPYRFLLTIAGLLVSFNRVSIGVHYIADVVAGLFFGLVAGAGWFVILGIAGATLP